MESIVQGVFWLVFAIFLALFEIEIEGHHGWAYSLPTWYRRKGIGKVYGAFMHKKPMTGYHIFLLALLFLIFHAHYFQGVKWNLEAEFSTLGLIMTISVIWDYLWFVLNPYFGYQSFRKEKIWWHAKSTWLLGFPSYFYSRLITAFVLNILANKVESYLLQLAIFIVGTIIVIILSPLYHGFYNKMRENDERHYDEEKYSKK